jgi:hypothetical protein
MAGFDRKQARMVESVPTRPIAAEFHSLDKPRRNPGNAPDYAGAHPG